MFLISLAHVKGHPSCSFGAAFKNLALGCCFGFTSMPILPDVGVFGSDDIVAIDQAVLDATSHMRLIEENLPTSMEVHTREGHPLRWLHGPHKDPYKVTEYGEQLGLGSRQYELIDVLPVEQFARSGVTYISAK